MPKEARQFRKGTKSCVECRQRKLRCIPSDDDHTQSCQNCAAKGRNCVLQVHAGRSDDTPNVTSRDRIRQLEDSVGKLWSIVRELRNDPGQAHADPAQNYGLQSEEQYNDESESDASDMSPMNPPINLTQLFDNAIVDRQGGGITSPENSTDKATSNLTARSRSRLQSLLPANEDVQALAPFTQAWFNVYNQIFPPFTMFKTVDELLAQYEGLHRADASVYTLAALLLWMAIAVQNASPEILRDRSESIKEGLRFVRQISDTIEEVIVTNDTLAGSIEGIEISLLWVRLRLIGSNIRKVWLTLRRCIALAELTGLPRASQVVKSTAGSISTVDTTRQEGAAAVWESICVLGPFEDKKDYYVVVPLQELGSLRFFKSNSLLWLTRTDPKSKGVVDRIAGLMFNLPLGTAGYGFPSQNAVIAPDGQIVLKAYLNNLARIAAAVQDIDDTYVSSQSDTEFIDKVLRVDQELRSLRAMTPDTWWIIGPSKEVPHHLLQFWHYYLTARAHLQLALRNTTEPQCAYSYLTCTEACRELSSRYVKLRSILPLRFFAGRIVDLNAMTAAIFLVYTSHRTSVKPMGTIPDGGGQTSQHLAYDIVQMMESVCQGNWNQVGCDVARKASKAIRALDELLSQPAPIESQNLSLKIPLLGNISVSRHSNFKTSRLSEHFSDTSYTAHPQTYDPHFDPSQTVTQPFTTSAMGPADPLSWSMDLLMDDFPPPSDDFFSADQWFTFSSVG